MDINDEKILLEPLNPLEEVVISHSPKQEESSTEKAFRYITAGRCKDLVRHFGKHNDIDLRQAHHPSGRTLLHYAVVDSSRNRALIMTQVIMDYASSDIVRKKLLEIQDAKGETPLHTAAKNGRAKIVEVLLPIHPNFTLRGKDNQTALDCVYKNVPEAIVADCNRCLNYTQDGEDTSEELVTLDFSALIRKSGEVDDKIERLWETQMLGGLITERAERFKQILEHPVVQVFLHLKYDKGYPIIVASIVIQIIWQLIYGYFLFHIYFEACPWKRGEANDSVVTVECRGENIDFPGIYLAVIVWILAIIFFIKEIFEFSTVTVWRYFTQLENVGQLFGILSVIWTCWPIYERLGGAEHPEIKPWQYNVAAAAEFTIWTLILGQICKLQPLRIYIQIFVKVFKSFVLFICTFASLLFGFAAAFCIIMPEANAFKSPWLAVPKVLVMMTGELNYDDVFHNEEGTKMATTSHYFTTQILFSMFTILMSLILLNLLIGLAVTDTQELKENCRTAELSSMLEEVYLLESFATRLWHSFQFKWLLERLSVSTTHSNPFWLKHSAEIDNADFIDESKDLSKINYKITLEFSKASQYPFPYDVMDKLRELCESHKVEMAEEEENSNASIL